MHYKTNNGVEYWINEDLISLEDFIKLETETFPYLHREDGPAYIIDGLEETWIRNGKLHRIDGPAIIDHMEPWTEYYIHGIEIPEETFIEAVEFYKEEGPEAFILMYKT